MTIFIFHVVISIGLQREVCYLDAMAEEDVNFDLTAKKKKKKKKTPFDLDGLEGAEVSLNNLFFAADRILASSSPDRTT